MPTTAQVAKIANVSLQSVRNWTRQYPELFTPEARGEAADGVRLFSDRDVEVMCAIADLRKSGVPSSEVIARINNGDVPPIVDIEATPHESPHEAPTAPHEAQDTQLALYTAHNALQAHLQATDATVQALQRQIELVLAEQKAMAAEQRAQLRSEKWWNRLEGAIGGLVLAGFLLWLGWSLVNGAPW